MYNLLDSELNVLLNFNCIERVDFMEYIFNFSGL